MEENLQEMIKNLNSVGTDSEPKSEENAFETIDETGNSETIDETKLEEKCDENTSNPITIMITNFYDWFEKNAESIHNISRVKAEVSNVDPKDNMIFKIKKGKDDLMELISFYNPSLRPILSLPPVYVNIFKNDTFVSLHQISNDIFLKSYGTKAGLIVITCCNIDGKIIPFEKTKVKKGEDSIKINNCDRIVNFIKEELTKKVNDETVLLLYKQASKFKDVLTTKENTIQWFLNKQNEVVDINHLLKIDNVIINVIFDKDVDVTVA